MTRAWGTFTAKQRALAEKVFDALSMLDAIGDEGRREKDQDHDQ